MIVTKISTISGNVNSMDLPITQEQLNRYNEGTELIQNVFPNLTPDQREFLISGITANEWATTFGEGLD